MLCFSLFALVVMTFLSGSLRFTQLAMIGASCFGGLVWFRGFREHLPASAPWAATVIVGMLYIAQVNSYSSIPRLTYLLVALAPILGDLAAQVASMKHQSRVFLAVSSVLLLVAISWATIVDVLANLGNEY